ncbi:hypothetical protein BBJ28_00010562 [Nothophytophthora sp. Chile5]|nr:hypothetical protein BBJ28_00010562 [Nothophytophthora sp. Chile5]
MPVRLRNSVANGTTAGLALQKFRVETERTRNLAQAHAMSGSKRDKGQVNDAMQNTINAAESSRFRQALIWCITWKRFDQFILVLIFANSTILALADYSKVDANGDLDSSQSVRNAIVNSADTFFTTIFSIECTMKIIAMGLFGERGAYLMDPWNWMDFVVVFIGILAVIPGIPNVSSIPELLTVVAFLCFLFFLYGIIGVQLWSGVLHPRCRLTPSPLRLDANVTPDDFPAYQSMALANVSLYMCVDESNTQIPLSHAIFYFVSFIIFGSFVMLNLTLAVIWENFSEASFIEAEERKQLKNAKANAIALRGASAANEQAPASRLRQFFGVIVHHWTFHATRTALILLNTIILSLDQYPIDQQLNDTVEKINFGLTIAFTFEALLKIAGLGWKLWLQDRYNLFDALVVILSMVEVGLSPPDFIRDRGNTSKTASFSGLRSVRLFALFKLARSWPSLQKLLATMISTLGEVGNFSVLFMLFIYIYALIGMQTFANQLRFDEHGFPVGRNHTAAYIPRSNFDTMLWSVVTVFQNWNVVMLDGWRASGWSAVLYFISLVVLGNFIVLNLFLAILLGNFDESSDEERNIERAALKQRSRVAPTNQSSRFEQSGRSGRFDQECASSAHTGSRASRREPLSASSNIFTDQLSPSSRRRVSSSLSGRLARRSLFVFSIRNPIRKTAINTLMHPHFDNVSLVLIIVSTVELAIDNPLSSPDNALVNVLSWFDSILTVLFMLEVAIKIVATGFVLHDGAYLRNSWNVMDFAITAVAGFFMGQGSSKFKFVKTLRTFRALRPLRMINRNPGLKLVVSSLIASIPQILNVIMVCLLVFIIFSILAVNNLKGKFYSCQGDVFNSLLEAQQELIVTPRIWSNLTLIEQTWFSSSSAETFQSLGLDPLLLTSRAVCTLFGASWNSTIPQNFDNVISGIQTFFELTTTEGWVTVMLASVDATEIDMQPVPNYREGWTFFFIAFILVGTFFVMQLFVGVVIENFNKMKEKLEGTYLLTSTQREWLVINEAMLNLRPKRKLRVPLDRTQRAFFRLALSQNLEMIIMGCVMLNTVIMALNYFGEEDLYETTLEYSNYFFSTIFALEAIVKIIGLRRNYWKDSWNLFDFVIVLGTSCGMLYHFFGGSTVGTAASAVRSFRVGRLFRLLHSAPSLRQLFNTLLVTLPSLVNIGGLLFLVFFIYAAMGVQLFAKVKLGPLNTSSSNFQTIAGAMVTLVRCSTGERWNDLMFELANQDDCVTDPSYDPNMCGFSSDVDCVPLNGCGSPVAFAYLYSFTLLVTFILLNIFIAVILEGFANEKDREDGVLLPQHLSDQPLEAMPESLNLEHQWRKYLLSRKIRKQEQSMFRINHFNAATLLHRSVRSLIFREDLRRDVRSFQNLVERRRPSDPSLLTVDDA